MQYWLMKSEPEEVSIDDLAERPLQTLPWFGVRNYQARNLMRDAMHIGDLAFFYHSSCAEPGIAGICQVCSAPYPDPTQFATQVADGLSAISQGDCLRPEGIILGVRSEDNSYVDPKSKPENPRWWLRDVRFVRKTRYLPLAELRGYPELANMRLLARGNRLSITPVTSAEWLFITQELLA